jgi:hypothetical protein
MEDGICIGRFKKIGAQFASQRFIGAIANIERRPASWPSPCPKAGHHLAMDGFPPQI